MSATLAAPRAAATGFTISGKTSVTQGDRVPLTVAPAPAGSTVGTAQAVTLADNTGATFTPPSLSFLAGATAGQTTVYQPTLAGAATVKATSSSLGTATLAVSVAPYDSVHHRLMLAVVQVILDLHLEDLPRPGQGIPPENVLDQFIPAQEHEGLPGISVNLRGCTVGIDDLTFNYSDAILPDVELVGHYVNRPIQVDILDATDKLWHERYPLWLLWLERVQRCFLEPDVVNRIVAGVGGAVAAVPEFGEGNLEVIPDPVVDEGRHNYQQYKTGLRLNCHCSEAGLW
jgi:hypothetical protein